MSDQIELPEERTSRIENHYMNMVQLRATAVDANILIAEMGRATGKTEGVFGPRIIRVSDSMPGEVSFLVHKTYAALFTNVWPNIQGYFSRPVGDGRRTMLEEGQDYIVGSSKIPTHFKRPRRPVAYPKHSIMFRNGHHLQLVSSEQPESVAGQSGVHAFIEEMKHQKGEKIKTRLFPALRGSPASIRMSPYYQGITGVSDTARVDMGEDNWFEEYEKNVDNQLINEIVTVSLRINDAKVNIYRAREMERNEKNPLVQEAIRLQVEKEERTLALWEPRLNDMRRNATYYMRASSFANKDILGPKFFKTQMESLTMDEFLVAICAIRQKAVVDRFFVNYVPSQHQYSDSYKYESILKMDLKEHFRLTSFYLKQYNPREELLLGYDPGNFSSLVVAQEKSPEDTRIIKEFTCYAPHDQTDLARDFNDFFGADAKNKTIKLYYDRAANKRKEEWDQISTDAKILQRELESYGFIVELMNEGQAVIYYWQQYKLLQFIFGDRSNAVPRVTICENECPDLCSSIMLSPRKYTDGKIELDKSSERKIPLHLQAGLTTQLPSALIYLLFGRYSERLPSEYSQLPDDLPANIMV
ncbi:MAG: hypothetical protein PHQ67_06930 [Fermentimonas sp.]|nr:hypothetical protein [Fermentimonas sp.]MDD4698036.1 hypothetical protein [Fermentimonas sp.]